MIRGRGESWRSGLSSLLRQIVLLLLVGAVGFAVTRGIRNTLQPGTAELKRREVAAFVQASAGEPNTITAQAWIYRGWQELARHRDRPLEAQEPAGPRARGLERRVGRLEPGPDQHHLRGLLALRRAWVTPDQSGAVLREAERELAKALEDEPQRADAWNDLAAVYLTWAVRHDRPRLFLDAYAATHAALTLESDSAEARYNQALALEGLGLFQQAATTLTGRWPAWTAQEAIERQRAELVAIDPVALRERFLAALEEASEAEDVAGFLQQAGIFPQTARRWVEEILLHRWANASAAGDSLRAKRLLGLARALGEHIADPTDRKTLADPMLRETVAVIDRAIERGDHQRLGHLVRGHQAFGQGMQAFPEHLDEARARFSEAERSLAAGGSPFAGWAGFYRGACQDYQGDKAGALAIFESLQRAEPGSPSLDLRAHWGQGLIFDKLELLEAAGAEYADALTLADRLDDGEFRAALGWLGVRVLSRLGREDDAWRSLSLSLAARDEPESPIHRGNALYYGADRARDAQPQHPVLAATWQRAQGELQLLFRRAAVEAARKGPPTAFAQNRLELAKTLVSVDRSSEAMAILDRSEQELSQVPSADTRARLVADAAFAKSRLGLFGEVRAARDALTEAYATYDRSGSQTFAIDAALELARLEHREGDGEAARDWIERCLDSIEQAVTHLPRPGDRARYLRSVRSVYQVAFGLAFDAGDAEELSDLFDRRAKTLRIDSPGEAPMLSPGVATVWIAYLDLADGRLVALTRSPKGARATLLPITASELSVLIAELAKARRLPDAYRTVLASLHLALIEPIVAALPAEGRLALCLDEPFFEVPFAGLWDEANNSYLIERFELAVVTRPGDSRQEDGDSDLRRAGGALIVAANEPADVWGFPDLPEAEVEAETLSGLLRATRTLTGRDATAENVLAALPGMAIFHFAGHALADPTDASSSLLILGEGADRRAAISLRELERLDLSGLRLVVLAGCQTARGGTANLARAVALSSDAVVIGSLWNVDDAATARFFEDFYSRLAAGVPPIRALRETQVNLLQAKTDHDQALAVGWLAFWDLE